MTASSPAAPDARTETIQRLLNDRGNGDTTPEQYDEGDAALASLDAELTASTEETNRWRRRYELALDDLNATRQALQAVWDYERWDEWEEITGPKNLKRAFDLARAVLAGERKEPNTHI